MIYELKGVIKEIARFMLTLAILFVVFLSTIFLSQEWETKLNRKVVDSGYPILRNEQLKRGMLKHGVSGLELRCGQWTFTRDRDGRICKAFKEGK